MQIGEPSESPERRGHDLARRVARDRTLVGERGVAEESPILEEPAAEICGLGGLGLARLVDPRKGDEGRLTLSGPILHAAQLESERRLAVVGRAGERLLDDPRRRLVAPHPLERRGDDSEGADRHVPVGRVGRDRGRLVARRLRHTADEQALGPRQAVLQRERCEREARAPELAQAIPGAVGVV